MSSSAGPTASMPTQRQAISRHSMVSERDRSAGPCHSAATVRRSHGSNLGV